jgi:hypothetical protein
MSTSSLRRIRSSRTNGARLRGPKSIAGKQRSFLNALRHGPLAKQAVLFNEASANFDLMIAQHIQRFGLADGVGLGMIEEMDAAFSTLAASPKWPSYASMRPASTVCISAICISAPFATRAAVLQSTLEPEP